MQEHRDISPPDPSFSPTRLSRIEIRRRATKEEKKERGCIDCQPSLTITEIEAK